MSAQIKLSKSYKRKSLVSQAHYDSNTNNNYQVMVKNQNPKNAKMFQGSNFSDFAVWIQKHFILLANHHGVLEIIREGTINGYPFVDLKSSPPTLLESKVKHVNKLLFKKCQIDGQIYEHFKGILLCHPILQYILTEVVTTVAVPPTRGAVPPGSPPGTLGPITVAGVPEVTSSEQIPIGLTPPTYNGMTVPDIVMPTNAGIYEALISKIPYLNLADRTQVRTDPDQPTNYQQFWNYVPELADLRDGDLNTPRIFPYSIHDLVQKICDIIYQRDSLEIDIEKSFISADNSNFNTIFMDSINSLEETNIRDENQIEISHWKKQDSYITAINEKCSTVMQLLGPSCCSHVTKLLENKQWHQAWISVLQLMASKGLSTLTEVQDEIKTIKIEIGEDWNNLLERFQEANNKLAILTDLHNESLLPSFDLAKHKFNNEMSDDNSFDKTDTEITALHGSVLIREATRVSNLLRSIETSVRFEFPYNEISGWKLERKTMKKILEHLSVHDLSARGQKVFAEEIESIKNKKPKHDSTVLVTEKKVYPKGSCTNHPDSTTHTTADCLMGKKNPAIEKEVPTKSIWDKEEILPGKFKCKYCAVHHLRIHKTHPTNECSKDPKSPCYGKPLKGLKVKDAHTSKMSAFEKKIDKVISMITSATSTEEND